MKHIIKISALIIIFVQIFAISLSGEDSESWYILKKDNSVPVFPKNADFLTEHGCYYVDNSNIGQEEKYIYLTFDAGYDNGNIGKILDILKEEDVKGAFFVLSYLLKHDGELVRRMINEGHLVCNHTKNHKNMTTLTKEEMRANLETLESLCYETTGYKMPKYFRYPEGRYNTETILSAEEFGYKTFFWSMAYADWDNAKQPNSEVAIKTLQVNTHPGAIVLLHPTSKTNVEILGHMIKWWKNEGYTFGTLDDLVLHN